MGLLGGGPGAARQCLGAIKKCLGAIKIRVHGGAGAAGDPHGTAGGGPGAARQGLGAVKIRVH